MITKEPWAFSDFSGASASEPYVGNGLYFYFDVGEF